MRLNRHIKQWRFATIEEITTTSLDELKNIPKALIRSASRIGKSAGTSVLNLRGIILNGTI